MKKLFIFLFLGFIVFLWSLYYFHIKELEAKAYLKKIQQIKSKLEEEKLAQLKKVKVEEEKNTENKEKILEEMVAKQLSDVNDILNSQEKSSKSPYKVIYQKLYLSAMKKNNSYMAIKAIKRLLPYTDNKDVWLATLVDLEMQVGNFSEAEKYAQKLVKIAPTKENLKKYLYVLFQTTNFFDKKQVEKLKQVISLLYDKKVLNGDDLSFYNFLISLLSNWDIKQISSTLPLMLKDIKDSTYKNLLQAFKNDLKTYEASKGSPKYYFQALVALDLLKFGYFGLAKNIAEQVHIQDSAYILPLQILAYSYFYMWNYQQAVKYFQQLKQQDISGENDYDFFIGVSYYWLWKYTKALLFLSQVGKKSSYYEDVLRYKLLSYMGIEDTQNVIKTIQELSNYKLNYVDYYNIFKYLLFKCKDCYKKNLKLLVTLMKDCYSDVDKNHQYVCWYGKWNLFLKAWKTNLAVSYLKLLSNYFQDTYIWDTLAKYYEEKKDYKKARYYYLKELLYTSNPTKREELKRKIKEMFLQSSK